MIQTKLLAIRKRLLVIHNIANRTLEHSSEMINILREEI